MNRSERGISLESRREQIVQAARACIIEAGIHGASMAEIAARAELGVGQVYRVFASKEALIARIAADELAEMRAMLDQLAGQPGPLIDALCALVPEAVDRCFDPDRGALKLELAAEAARNTGVAVILRASDRDGRAAFESLMDGLKPADVEAAAFEACCASVYVLFEGLAIRAINHPQADRAALASLVSMLLRRLFCA
jgi:TetR/AcrR family transcriptional repressor of uid operon